MKPVILIVLDGWGIAPASYGNAITSANLPYYNKLLHTYPHGLLETSGESVGLPRGEDGNTETGHINLGAGFIVHQDLPRINLSIADGSFFSNKAFLSAIEHAKKNNSNLHFLGLVGAGGVHSNIEHLLALLQLTKEHDFKRVFLHLITDGRDSPPKSAYLYIDQIQSYLDNLKYGEIATVMGRYYAMDRDLRWERTHKAYLALTEGIGEISYNAKRIITNSYSQGMNDEFIRPSIIEKGGRPTAVIAKGDSVIFFNYRIDRPRQLTKAFVLDNFNSDANQTEFDPYAVKYFKKHAAQLPSVVQPFTREKKIEKLYFVTMTQYSPHLNVSNIAFPPKVIEHPLAESISLAGLKQLHMSESEKERFVTFYFNGQRENPFPGEDNIIIPSPKVPTYDLTPAMSAKDLTEELIHSLHKKKYDFIIINYANPDMVAHTGNIPATIKACEVIDECLLRIIPVVLQFHGIVLITADHGNAEEMINPHTADIDTEHSTYPVPFIAVSDKWNGKNIELPFGTLSDIAPTILSILNIEIPHTMTGRNLLLNVIH